MKIRTIKTLLLAALFTLAATANSQQIVTLVESVELSPSNIILPGSTSGMVTYRPCAAGCDEEYQRARLTEDTAFYVDDRRVKFTDFTNSFSAIRTKRDSYALVSVDTKQRTVTSIRISG